MATLTIYIFGVKHDIDNWVQVRWQLEGVSYTVSKRHELCSTKGLKFHRSFYPPSINSVFCFIGSLPGFVPCLFSRSYSHGQFRKL